MAEHMQQAESVHHVATRMQTDDTTAQAWVDAMIEARYETFKAGQGLTLSGLDGLNLERKRDGWAFTCNPGQKLRALIG